MSKTKKHSFHLHRLLLFSVLLAAFFIVRTDANAVPFAQTFNTTNVLAYATEMSQGGLLNATNSARAANGMPALNLDSQLNASAQAKAQDMADKDYWAHVSPDGTEPWYFFTQAGYSYSKAGENLAYGFMTSQATVDGWMNSPSHRANMLDGYYDVGFGIVNAPNYQSSGPQTIVVAHYGVRAMTTQAAEPAPAAPAQPEPTPAPAPAPQPPAPEPEPAAVAEPNKPEKEQPPEPVAGPVQTAEPERVSILSMIASRSLPVAGLISLVLVSIVITGYALTHRAAFQHAVAAGEHFAVKHPGIDAGLIAAVTAMILLTTYGSIG